MTSISITHPEVAKEWHHDKNSPLLLENISAGSVRKVWWRGACNHEWQSVVQSRTNGSKCPYCNNRKALAGFNDFATKHPEVAAQWHPDKNEKTPSEFLPASHAKVWWLGECGHEWEAEIANRTFAKSNCPYCSGNAVLVGFNDISTTHPDLMKEWHLSLNSEKDPKDVSAGSSKKVWWQGEQCKHEWEATPKARAKGSGCPACSGNKLLPGFNDLATKYPLVALEWHPTKNGDLLPSMVSPSSSKKAWWLCSEGHEWEITISSREGRGCPICSNKRVLVGFNDFGTTHPEMSIHWHPELNGLLTPQEVVSGSSKKVWWLCKDNHTWEVSPNQRSFYNTDCPVCPIGPVSKSEQALADFLVSKGFKVRQTVRDVLPSMELDILLPEFNVAIEYNGVYWHSEKNGRMQTYHYDKWVAAKKAGINLIQIWEDEYDANPTLVQNMILHKLGVSTVSKVFARSTVVCELGKGEIEVFLNANHIQGYASGSCYYGLRSKDNDELIAVMVLKMLPNNTVDIVRYATSANVVGGFTKLLKHAERSLLPERFITFSDHCVSDGGLYRNNGFVVERELAPDYRYVVGNQRKHKFGYRLKRFKTDPALKYEEGLTERELALLNNLPRIWDAGKTKWVLEVSQ